MSLSQLFNNQIQWILIEEIFVNVMRLWYISVHFSGFALGGGRGGGWSTVIFVKFNFFELWHVNLHMHSWWPVANHLDGSVLWGNEESSYCDWALALTCSWLASVLASSLSAVLSHAVGGLYVDHLSLRFCLDSSRLCCVYFLKHFFWFILKKT